MTIPRIKEAKTIAEIAEIRKRKNEADRDNDDNTKEILAELYSSSTHFIFELLQNAEDASAEEVSFQLNKNELVFTHNGRDFNIENIIAITNVGRGTKMYNDKIGKFGIGFKSVFSISETPKIYSGAYAFEIQDRNVPVEIPGIRLEDRHTVFVFPFKKDVFAELETMFMELKEETILFLSNITKICISMSDKRIEIIKTKELPKVIIERIVSGTRKEKRFLLFSQPSQANNNFEDSIAFALNEEDRIIAEPNTPLYVFFPTKTRTGLNFYINAPFDIDKTRANVKENKDSEHNERLWQELYDLFDASLTKIKAAGLAGIDLLNALPIGSNPKYFAGLPHFYNRFWEKTFNNIKNGCFIPTADGTLRKAADIVFTDKFMLDLVPLELLAKTMGGKLGFVDTVISEKKNEKLNKYLKEEHYIGELNLEKFTSKLDENILSNVSDEWLLGYYRTAGERLDSFIKKGSMRDIPIIRTENGKHVKAMVNELPNVYYPADWLSPDKKIKTIFYEDEGCHKFFELLKITVPDETETLRAETLPKLKQLAEEKKFDLNEYLNNFNFILKVYDLIKNDNTKKERIRTIFQKEAIFFCKNHAGKTAFLRPDEFVLNSVENKDLYNGCNEVFLLSDDLCYLGTDFFLAVGANKNFIIRKLNNIPEHKRATAKTPYFTLYGHTYVDYEIVDFGCVVSRITYEKSHLIADFVLKEIASDSCFAADEWYHYNKLRTYKNPSDLFDKVTGLAWVVKDGEPLMPSEITETDFMELYGMDTEIMQKSIRLKFAPDVLDLLSEEDRKIIELNSTLSPVQQEKIMKLMQEMAAGNSGTVTESEEIWGEGYVVRDGAEYLGLSSDEIEERNIENNDDICDDEDNKENSHNSENNSPKQLKEIGKRGEEKVLERLYDETIENGYLIINGEKGKNFEAEKHDEVLKYTSQKKNAERVGYDIEIKRNDAIIEYIEVKTKRTDAAERISLSGTQWKVARECHENQTPKYSLYVVSAGGNIVINKVGNPYSLWVEGRLFASPVEIKIK